MTADRPGAGGTRAGSFQPPGQPPTAPSDLDQSPAGRVSALDRITLQLGVAVVIAACSYAVSATSLAAQTMGSQRPALPAGPRSANTTTVGARLQAAYAQPRPDG